MHWTKRKILVLFGMFSCFPLLSLIFVLLKIVLLMPSCHMFPNMLSTKAAPVIIFIFLNGWTYNMVFAPEKNQAAL